MKITTIQISGFRKILKATINMEDDITVIAGANNSGKTSIVELFNYVCDSTKSRFMQYSGNRAAYKQKQNRLHVLSHSQ